MSPRLLASLLALVVCTTLAADPPKPDTAPDNTELLFWQSAERLGTAEAYRAYLARYPQGVFAPLATAAINKAVEVPKAVAPTAAPEAVRPAAATLPAPLIKRPPETGGSLERFTSPPPSTAVTFNLGDVFEGPVGVEAGWLGARKQLVLPDGRWMVLAARDDYIMQVGLTGFGSQRVKFTTAAFGKFHGTRLAALLKFTFTSEKTTTLYWSGVDGCERSSDVKLQVGRPGKNAYRDECMALSVAARPLADDSKASADVRESLGKLRASVSGIALVSTFGFSEKQRGYLDIARFDWPGVWLGDDGQTAGAWQAGVIDASPARQAYLARLSAWAERYRAAAANGYAQDFAGSGASAPDFNPAAAD